MPLLQFNFNFVKMENIILPLLEIVHHYFWHFSYKCKLKNYSCLVYPSLPGPKKGLWLYVNLKTYISQSTWNWFLKFFPHVLKSQYSKILPLQMSKNDFFSKICYLYQKCLNGWMADSERFWWKHRQGSLGVKCALYTCLAGTLILIFW